MQCPQCQFENVDGAKFCNECGCKLEVSCSKCGKPNPPGSKFCVRMDNRLDLARDYFSNGEMLKKRGELEKAIKHFRAAHSIFEAAWDLRQVETVLKEM